MHLEHTRTGGGLVGPDNPEIPPILLWDDEKTSTGDFIADRIGRIAHSGKLWRDIADIGEDAVSVSPSETDVARQIDIASRISGVILLGWQLPGTPTRVEESQAAEAERLERQFTELRSSVRRWEFAATPDAWKSAMAAVAHVMDVTRDIGFEQTHADSGDENPYTGWNGVHFAICDFLRACMTDEYLLPSQVFEEHRGALFAVIERLVGITSAPSVLGRPCKEVWPMSRHGTEAYVAAAQALRSKAVVLLFGFMFREGNLSGDVPVISGEIRNLLEQVVCRETGQDPMFWIGTNFGYLYLLDADWARGLMDRIFPGSREVRSLYIAAWTGFLRRVPTREMFLDPAIQGLLMRGVSLKTDPDEHHRPMYYDTPPVALAKYLARTYRRLDEFGFDHPLLESFRGTATPAQVAAFVETVGKELVRDDAPPGDCLSAKLRKFWEWTLESQDTPAIFREFGDWIDLQNGVFAPGELARLLLDTLRKSSGELNTRSGLSMSVVEMVRADPVRSLECIRLCFEGAGRNGSPQLTPAMFNKDWQLAAQVLRADPSTKEEADRVFEKVEDLLAAGAVM